MAAEQAVTELIIDGSDVERAQRVVAGAFDHMGARAEAAQAKMDAMVARQLQIYGRDLPQAVTRVEDAYSRLQGKLDPVVAAQQRMEREMTQSLGIINRAVLLGVTTEQQATRDIARLKQQQVEAINRVRDAQVQANQIVAMNDNDPMAGSRRQVLGYQAFDIGQGLAAGTPWGIIAAQQGPQIAQLYAGQGGLNALWKDGISLLGGLVRAAAPWLIAAAGIYGAYRLIAAFGQEAALAIDSTTQALADQAAPLGTVRSQIDELGDLQKTYRDAILSTGESSTAATDKILANTRREFEAKKALLELEHLRQEAALRVNEVEMQRQGLALRQELGAGVNTRMDLERQGFADPRIGSVPFVRLPDDITGLERTQELIDKSPVAQKLKELRAEGELTRLTFERLEEALKATFDGTSLIDEKIQPRDPMTGRLLSNLPIPSLRGIDDQPGSMDFVSGINRQHDARMRQLRMEADLLGMTGAAAAAFRYEQETLADAYRRNIDLAPDQIAAIREQAAAYGELTAALERARLASDIQFDRSQLFRSSSEQAIASRLRGTGLGMDSPEADALRRTEQLAGYRSLGIDLLSGIRDGALSGSEDVGAAIMEGIANAANDYATKISDKLIEDVVTSGMKAFGLEDFGVDLTTVSSMQVQAASVVINGPGGGAGLGDVTRLLNPANSNDPLGATGGAQVEPVTRSALSSIGSITGGLQYINDAATRNLRMTETLEAKVREAVGAVYGEGAYASVYSGGQPKIGSGLPRVGSTRHDLGHAGDMRIFDAAGNQLTGDQLAPLAQYWQAKGWGGTGLEMRGGGIHLDEHAGRAPFWSYGNMTRGQRSAIEAGQKGLFPELADSATQATQAIDRMTTNSIDAANGLASTTQNLGSFGQSLSQLAQSFVSAVSGGSGWGMSNLFGLGRSNFGAGFTPGLGGGFAGLIGYASGTENAPPGWAWVGERGKELMRMRGGETIRNHDASMAMVRGQQRPVVNFSHTVVNNAGTQVRTEESEDADGNISIRTIVDGAVAKNLNKRGSQTERAFRQRGVRPQRKVR